MTPAGIASHMVQVMRLIGPEIRARVKAEVKAKVKKIGITVDLTTSPPTIKLVVNNNQLVINNRHMVRSQ